MDKTINIFKSPAELATKVAGEIVSMINESARRKKTFTIALSGGSTPELLFSTLGEKFSESGQWKYVHFFWVDERCVPPDSSESNWGMAKRNLFDRINIPEKNIHRIRGERDPEEEALRYSEEISEFTRSRAGFPLFDLILLGLGEDGHTASIFPGNLDLFSSANNCEVAIHPATGQKRITFTGKVINNADLIYFLVTGKKKAVIVNEIFDKLKSSRNLPSSYILPKKGMVSWFIDEEAGSKYNSLGLS
jgi:6-phosphogluconolactonase